ncbi:MULTISPECIES: cytochrome P450 [unclassified Streptomyces]|uniref:cytochrome P450 family protein n=1 Tax=Streptomyces TaxID=1883 RepID=UPI000B504F44|nr:MULTISPECIES: cytochrome P450 [unclassified Streptomyces]MYX00744.1 cytochrome P450 [Streptomyces sp. SID8378]SNB90453.1 Cytochrome P450 [Streptomyces sp. PgraA7]
MTEPTGTSTGTPPTVDLGPHADALTQNPHPLYAQLLEKGPIHRAIQPDGTETWLVLGHPEAKEALAHPSALSSDPANATPQWRARYLGDPNARELPQGRSMINSDPPHQTRLRKPVTRAFTPRRIDALRATVEEHADQLLQGLPRDAAFDVIDDFAAPLTLGMICTILGIPDLDRGRIRGWADRIGFPTSAEDVTAARHELIPYTDQLIADQRTHPGQGLLSALIEASDDGQMTPTELRATVFLLINAGHETVISLLASAVFCLLSHPDQFAALRDSPSLVDQAIDETLRCEPSVISAAPRFAREEITLGSTTIPGDGSLVTVVVASANRDPRQFTNPHTFDITRPPGELLSFGHGVHFCLGWSLARLEAGIALPALLKRFPDLAPASELSALRWRSGPIVRCLAHLPCTSGARPSAASPRNG